MDTLQTDTADSDPHTPEVFESVQFSSNALVHLKQSITLLHNQLIELISTHGFQGRVEEFANRSKQMIIEGKINEALIYLNQAEKILEYAANRGKDIPRNLIMTVLHNQATCYQQIWDLERCSNYIEALVYNLNEELRSELTFSSTKFLKESSIQFKSECDLNSKIQKMYNLARYHLLYCAINSQLKNNSSALKAGRKANRIIMKIFQEGATAKKGKQDFEAKLKINQISQSSNCNIWEEIGSPKDIQQLGVDRLKKLTKHYLKIWRNRCSLPNYSIKSIVDQMKDYTIGNIMQMQAEQYKNSKILIHKNNAEIFGERSFLQKVLLLSISHFTIATELRLLSVCNPSPLQSEAHHLFSIMLIARCFPFKILYIEHVLMSYCNHFGGGIMEQSIFQNRQIEQLQNCVWRKGRQIRKSTKIQNQAHIQDQDIYIGDQISSVCNNSVQIDAQQQLQQLIKQQNFFELKHTNAEKKDIKKLSNYYYVKEGAMSPISRHALQTKKMLSKKKTQLIISKPQSIKKLIGHRKNKLSEHTNRSSAKGSCAASPKMGIKIPSIKLTERLKNINTSSKPKSLKSKQKESVGTSRVMKYPTPNEYFSNVIPIKTCTHSKSFKNLLKNDQQRKVKKARDKRIIMRESGSSDDNLEKQKDTIYKKDREIDKIQEEIHNNYYSTQNNSLHSSTKIEKKADAQKKSKKKIESDRLKSKDKYIKCRQKSSNKIAKILHKN